MNSSSLLYSGAYRSISSWNLKERKEADSQIPHAHSDIVTDMIILKNLDTLVSCSLDRTIVNWDTSTNQAIATYDGHRTGVFNLSYSPAYRLLFSVGFDHDALVWSPFVGGMVYRLKGHMHTLVGCYASESKPEVVTADQSGTFKLWDVRNFECVQTWQMNDLDETQQPSLPTALSAFSFQSWPSDDPSQTDAHCRILAASKTISCFDQVRVKKQSTSDSAAVQAIYWNEVKSTVITVSECNVIVWDALVGSVIFFNENVQADITASCLDDRKRKVILGNLEGDIIVVNPANGVRMKSGSTYHKISAAVATLSYLDGKQQFVAGTVRT
jgi:WD40 repeat protein